LDIGPHSSIYGCVTMFSIAVNTNLHIGLRYLVVKSAVRKFTVIMSALGRPLYFLFLPCGFFLLLSSIFFLSSPNLSGRRLDVYHTCTHGVALMRI